MPNEKPSYRNLVTNLRALGLGISFYSTVWDPQKDKLWIGDWTCEDLATRGMCNRTTISRSIKILLAHGLAERVAQKRGLYKFTEAFYRLPFTKRTFPLGPEEP